MSKKLRYPSFSTLLVSVFLARAALLFGQSADVSAFRAMTDAQQFRYINELPYHRMTIETLRLTLGPLVETAEAQHRSRVVFALKFRLLEYGHLTLGVTETSEKLAAELVKLADAGGWAAEKIVARQLRTFQLFELKKITQEQVYAEVLQIFEQMETIGLEQFQNYSPETMLFTMSEVVEDLDDNEKMFRMVAAAEPFLHDDGMNEFHTTIILNRLQTYHQRKKDFQKAIPYAQKIIQFNRKLDAQEPGKKWGRRFWQGLASLSIAKMYLETGQLDSVERYSTDAYELSRVGEAVQTTEAWNAEFDALLIHLNIKMQLGKMGEAETLARRIEQIKPKVAFEDFRQLKYNRIFARYHELRGNLTAAVRCSHLVEWWQDSINRGNKVREFEQIERRLDAEKYVAKLALVEREKQLQRWLFYAAVAVFGLVLLLGFNKLRQMRARRRLALAELEAARMEIEAFADSLREKSEMAENLRLEMQKLADSGGRSEYLEQLTQSVILTDDDWLSFRNLFEKVHPGFMEAQRAERPDLTQGEMRYLVLEKLGLNTHEMANMLGVADGSVRKLRRRLEKKILEEHEE